MHLLKLRGAVNVRNIASWDRCGPAVNVTLAGQLIYLVGGSNAVNKQTQIIRTARGAVSLALFPRIPTVVQFGDERLQGLRHRPSIARG